MPSKSNKKKGNLNNLLVPCDAQEDLHGKESFSSICHSQKNDGRRKWYHVLPKWQWLSSKNHLEQLILPTSEITLVSRSSPIAWSASVRAQYFSRLPV